MTTYAIGALRHRLTLEAVQRSDDGGGGADETWIAVADVWAAITPLAGTEGVAADGVSGTLTHEIVLRWRAGVTPAMRLRRDARVFEILAVRDVDERRRQLRCLCMERDL